MPQRSFFDGANNPRGQTIDDGSNYPRGRFHLEVDFTLEVDFKQTNYPRGRFHKQTTLEVDFKTTLEVDFKKFT